MSVHVRREHRLTQRCAHARTGAARIFDVVVVLVFLPAAIILCACIALSVKIDSPGPLLYRARRVGRGGRDFDMFKFRTMTRETEGGGLRVKNDLRQTPLGRMLSVSHLNELPQLWNVLRGDMSLVGPRPEAREFVAEQPNAYAEILAVRPGLTGPTQLEFIDERDTLARVPAVMRREFYVVSLLPIKVASDLGYVRQRTTSGDLRLLLRTGLAMVARAGSPRSRRSLAQSTLVGASSSTLTVMYIALVAAPVA